MLRVEPFDSRGQEGPELFDRDVIDDQARPREQQDHGQRERAEPDREHPNVRSQLIDGRLRVQRSIGPTSIMPEMPNPRAATSRMPLTSTGRRSRFRLASHNRYTASGARATQIRTPSMRLSRASLVREADSVPPICAGQHSTFVESLPCRVRADDPCRHASRAMPLSRCQFGARPPGVKRHAAIAPPTQTTKAMSFLRQDYYAFSLRAGFSPGLFRADAATMRSNSALSRARSVDRCRLRR